MKTVVIFLSLGVLVLSSAVSHETKSVDSVFIERQKKVLSLIRHVNQINLEAGYYKLGKDYDIEANINNYTDKHAVEEFLILYRHGLLPKLHVFSVFNEKMRNEAIALYKLFYYAKDFETFYKTAAFARIYVNEAQFLYAYSTAILHREDTSEFTLPPLYEVVPQYYVNSNILFNKIFRFKMHNELAFPESAVQYGIVQENENYIFYSNYSNYLNYDNEEQKITYFTEDVGLNSYYYYFHVQYPFWMEGDNFKLRIMKQCRGEVFYMFYQRLLARYYMERLSNNLGKIEEFSWRIPFKNGYRPFLFNVYPFIQRTDDYQFVTKENFEDLRFLDAYEKNFIGFLENMHFKANNREIDLHDSNAINFVGNYWQSNADLYEKTQPRHYMRSYQEVARRVLSATPKSTDQYTVVPSALEFYQTSVRDPAFFQLYSRILKYIWEFKQNLKPYTWNDLHYVGVKINDVKIDPLITYFEYFDFDVTNGVYVTREEYTTLANRYKVRQSRLNHEPFSVTIDVKSDVAAEVVVKVFIGPKYDSNGYPISLENNWMNFLELDWFKYNIVQGENKITRKSKEFMYFQDDLVSVSELYKLFEKNQIPKYKKFMEMPDRLMLPRGTKGGFSFQIFVIIYPSETLSPVYDELSDYTKDMKPITYPFDRPPKSIYFNQPNMHFEDVLIYHKGDEYTYKNTIFYGKTKSLPKN